MADDRFQLRIITPERVFYEGEASMIELTTTEGEIGVYKNHVPLTYIIAPGILRIMETGETKEAALHSGFIEILQEKITILAEAIDSLTEKEQRVIAFYYFEELTLKEISKILEVSESRVSQLHTKALRKMRDRMGDDISLFAHVW